MENDKEKPNTDPSTGSGQASKDSGQDGFSPKQRFLIKLAVSIGTAIYALVELIKILKYK